LICSTALATSVAGASCNNVKNKLMCVVFD
jgi:hypothetical protein